MFRHDNDALVGFAVIILLFVIGLGMLIDRHQERQHEEAMQRAECPPCEEVCR